MILGRGSETGSFSKQSGENSRRNTLASSEQFHNNRGWLSTLYSRGLYTHCKGFGKGLYRQRDDHSHFCPQNFLFKKMTPTPAWVITWLKTPALVATRVCGVAGYVGVVGYVC